MSIVACGIFGYTISAISAILSEVNKMKEELQLTLYNVNRFMAYTKVSFNI